MGLVEFKSGKPSPSKGGESQKQSPSGFASLGDGNRHPQLDSPPAWAGKFISLIMMGKKVRSKCFSAPDLGNQCLYYKPIKINEKDHY